MKGSQFNSSYFFDFDDEHGWGNSSYFTYFSQFNRLWFGLAYIEAIVLFILFLISTFGNITLIYEIVRTSGTRNVTNFLVCNLAVADILFTASSPLIAIVRISETWTLGQFTCSLIVYFLFTCGSVLIWTMTVISIDRYLYITKSSKQRLHSRSCLLILGLIWLLALIAFIPLALYFNVKTFPFGNKYVDICTLVWPKTSVRISLIFTTTAVVIGYVIPVAIISFSYFYVFKRFWTARRAIMQSDSVNDSIWTHSMRSKKARRRRDFKVIKTLVMLVILFVCMWMPIFVVFIFILMVGIQDYMSLSSQAFIGTLAVTFVNACVNPVVYGFMNDKIRKSVFPCDCTKMRRKNSEKSISERVKVIRTLSFSQSQNSSNQ